MTVPAGNSGVGVGLSSCLFGLHETNRHRAKMAITSTTKTSLFIRTPKTTCIGYYTTISGILKAKSIHNSSNTTDSITMNEEQMAMDFWGRLEIAQKNENKNLKAVCKNIGIPYQTLINQKSAARLPALSVAMLLASELNSSLDWLLFGDRTATENDRQLISALLSDARKRAIVEKVSALNQSELFAIEVFLGIRK